MRTRSFVFLGCATIALLAVVGGRAFKHFRGNASPSRPHLADVDTSLQTIADAERKSPRDRWDPDYVVAKVGRDPQALFEWVRDNTIWIP